MARHAVRERGDLAAGSIGPATSSDRRSLDDYASPLQPAELGLRHSQQALKDLPVVLPQPRRRLPRKRLLSIEPDRQARIATHPDVRLVDQNKRLPSAELLVLQ